MDLSRVQPDPTIQAKPRTLFMLGSLDWLPNQEGRGVAAARGVARASTPKCPTWSCTLPAATRPRTCSALRGENVFMHGFVESAAGFMQQYELMLVPLLSGGGMRVKIIEGMAVGKAILSTTLGAEGIAVRDGHDIVLRDSPAAWLDALRAWARGETRRGGHWRRRRPHRHRGVRQPPHGAAFCGLVPAAAGAGPAGTPAHSPVPA